MRQPVVGRFPGRNFTVRQIERRHQIAHLLKRLLESKIDGVEVDDWLEGWTIGTLNTLVDGRRPPRILDIEIGHNPRLYRGAVATAGSTLTGVAPSELDTVSNAFDLMLALSFERAECLRAVDPHNAYGQAELLSRAARLLAQEESWCGAISTHMLK